MTATMDGRVALVTGGLRGIGFAAARALVARGAKVWLADLKDSDDPAVADALSSLSGSAYVQLDVTQEAAWQDAIAQIDKADGRLDVLVNNAGIDGTGRVQDLSLDKWRRVQAVNSDAAFLGTKHAYALLEASGKDRKGGSSIVNVSSIMGLVTFPDSSAYCASKGAIRQFSKACAVEFAAHGVPIRANSIHPGFVQTPLLDEGFDAMVARGQAQKAEDLKNLVSSSTPVGRLATAQEIGDAIAFLASEESSYMTGSEMVVDGGYVAR
ncbi:SDR family NAD(P)-dependent oxidoreductase [Croceicoccus mobilis]|uniref:Short-chain dehydrogenase n=1 Tax=Croceicoccus mobilis TaxID=1703339 RepID=A0A916Z6E1_9SPHN|nr:SDR family oxidoreductase [Croceicoccus mobilis]GGD78867.1 short-chain dehydrogenase [Croceicoccus mobilis]